MHLRPASITENFDESTITGTRAISGSAAIRLRKVYIASAESRSPSVDVKAVIFTVVADVALLPAAGYLGLHLLESQMATPLALGHTINLNPLAIILWLMIWGWMWGIVGLLLAVPLLVVMKIACDRIPPLSSVGEFLGG